MANKFFAAIKARFFSSPSSTAVDIGVNGDAQPRLSIDAGGRINFGSGASGTDTNLYRDDANVLKTDDTFKSAGLYVGGIQLDTTGAENGEYLIYDGTKFAPSASVTGEPIGFVNRPDSTISFTEGTRTFSISPASTSYEVWCKGKRHIKTSTETVQIPDTSGLYYIYFSSTGVLSQKTSFFDWESDTPVAYIYWNATDHKAYFFADERHGVVLDWQTHEYLHRTRGAAYASGFGIGSYNTTGDGSSDSHMKIDIADGTFFDEDLQIDVTHSSTPVPDTWQQVLEFGAEIPIMYRSGSVWKLTTATKFPVKQGTLPQYNLDTAGTWSSPDLTTGHFGVTYVVATNNLNYPVIGILGQAQYANINKVHEEDYFDLNLYGLPIFEIRPLYKLVYLVSTTFTNTPKAALREIIDIRTYGYTGTGVSPTPVQDHGSLLGLSDDDHPQYVHTTAARTITALHTFSNGLISDDEISTDTLSVGGIEIDVTGAELGEALTYDGSKFIPKAVDVSTANILYVSKSGNDNNDGTTLAKAKATIKAALAVATADTAVYVKSGDYTEANPITVPAKVALIGDSARTTTIRPANVSSDIVYVNNASYITGFTFKDHVSPAAAISFNPNGSAGNITQSPYVFDCSSLTTTGTGMRVDGSVVTGGKSMLAGQFTQINLGGIGIHLLNQGYAQLIAIYTICCDISVLAESGGFCSLIGSDTSFGNYGLKATGVSSLLYSGTASGGTVFDNQMTITGLSQRPNVNNVVTFDDGETYYSIDGVTPLVGGSSTITLDQTLSAPVTAGATAKFYQTSRIMAANHTFEYCGSGTDLVNSRPQFGGIPIQENEIVEELGGQVFYTSTDHKGDFRIGSDLKIDRGSGNIQGIAFDRSLFATITPYILALEG